MSSSTNPETATNAGKEYGTAYGTGIGESTDTVRDGVNTLIDTAASETTSNAGSAEIANAGAEVAKEISTAMAEDQTVNSAAQTLVTNAVNTTILMAETAILAGQVVAQKIGDGINGRVDDVNKAINTVIKSGINTAKQDANGFTAIGASMSSNLANGISSQASRVSSALNSILSEIKSAAREAASALSDIMNSVSQGNAAASEARQAANSMGGGGSHYFSVGNMTTMTTGVNSFYDLQRSIKGMAYNNLDIPMLATGTVVPPNKKFLSILGDNTKEHEVVSPLSTIKEAMAEVMGLFQQRDSGTTATVNLYIDQQKLASTVVDMSNRENSRRNITLVPVLR